MLHSTIERAVLEARLDSRPSSTLSMLFYNSASGAELSFEVLIGHPGRDFNITDHRYRMRLLIRKGCYEHYLN